MDVRENVCDFRNLYNALLKSKRNVLWKDSVAGYLNNALTNIYKLKQRLDDGTYQIQPYPEFVIYEPKERHIQSTKIPDRVFQRSLCDNYATKQVSKGFIYDNCACLENKGTDFARRRLKCHLQKHYRKYGLTGGVLKCDLKNYFGSTRHDVAKNAIAERMFDEWALKEFYRIIDTFAKNGVPVGIGLGSQASQLIQLAVIDDIDHFIKEKLHIKHYVRYMDDFILIHHDIEYLKVCKEAIQSRVEELGLTLNKNKTQIQPIKHPIHFLGFSFRLTETGKVIVKILPEKISHERRKLRKLMNRVVEGKMTIKQVDDQYASFKAHLSGRRYGKKRKRKPILKRNTHNLVLKFDKYYKDLRRNTMKILKSKEQAQKLQRENEELNAKLTKEQAKTDYIAMMAGIETDFKENDND